MKQYCLIVITLMLSACTSSHSSLPPAQPLNAGAPQPQAQQSGLPETLETAQRNGQIGSGVVSLRPSASYGTAPVAVAVAASAGPTQGDISLDFADTDVRTAVDQILGRILQQNYTIDPAVQGTVSLRTTTPLSLDSLLPTLQTLLAQVNAVLVRTNGIYRVMPASLAASSPNIASSDALGGAVVISLKYAQAASLATMLAPYVSSSGKIIPLASHNALIVEGDPSTRQALEDLIEAFDVDQLAGQSYELFPVTSGDAADFATAFSSALYKPSDPSQPGPILVVPLERMNAVLVIARTESLLSEAQRVYAVLIQVERETVRSWHVYYLHNGSANDAAYLLQQAFTPDDVTAQPTRPATGQVNTTFSGQSDPGGTGTGGSINSGSASSGAASSGGTPPPPPTTAPSGTASASALLGPLTSGGTSTPTNALRIIPDTDDDSLLVYATGAEDDRINAMLAQIDSAPTEVQIDATIAEVDLTGALQYGTQFFFKSGGINAVLSEGTTSALEANFPGFVLSGHNADGAPLAISLLQSVTKVDVLSSPELLVLNGQTASLQVGDLVPYLTQTSQSTLTSDSPVINSIDYRETGVILQVTPHVGEDDMVTMDVSQEVSGVEAAATTTGIDSPTFSDRSVTSRIAVESGQTIGLAGLISDSDSRQNQGIPYIKNVPLLGDLFSTQNNQRTRTELLVLITPHVIRTQSDAAALTADLREALPNAAGVPAALATLPASSSADPDAALRSEIPR